MSTAHKVLIHRWFEEVWNKKRESAIDEILAPDAVIHGVGGDPSQPIRGAEAFKQFWRPFVSAFPDLHIAVESTMAEDDKVVARCSVRGRHTGPGLGPATHKSVSFTGICLAHVREGQLTEGWNNFDFLLFYQQLGVLPPISVPA